jgi:protoporphyrinogen/coproporphyrinogen III oxidase
MIAIVGGGISGLAIGRALHRAGVPFTILESSGRTGGVIRSGRLDGEILEWGPQRGRLTPGLRALVQELGIGSELIVAPAGLPLLVYARGRLRTVPFSLAQALGGNLFPLGTRLRLLAEPLSRPALPDETAGAYFRRRFGRRAYEDLLGPLFGGLYASDPDEMLVRHALAPVLRQLGAERSGLLALARHALRRSADATPACSFTEGMETLPRAMHRSIAQAVRLGVEVKSIVRNGTEGFALETDSGTVNASHVVLTVAAPVASRLLRGISPDAARRIGSLTYNRFAVVHLRSGAELHGMGFQVSFAESLATRGVTFNSSLFGRRGIYTAFLGGARDPGLIAQGDSVIGELAASEFGALTGYAAEPISVDHVSIPAWDRSWTNLDGLVTPPGIELCANWVSRAGIPGRLASAAEVAERLSRPGPRRVQR